MEIKITKRMFAVLFSQSLLNSFHFTHYTTVYVCVGEVCPDGVDTLTFFRDHTLRRHEKGKRTEQTKRQDDCEHYIKQLAVVQ